MLRALLRTRGAVKLVRRVSVAGDHAIQRSLIFSSRSISSVGDIWQKRRIHSSRNYNGKIVTFNLPDVGEAIMTVVVKEWLVKPNDTVAMGDPICEVQSDKSAATIYCPHDGVIKELMYEVDDIAKKDEPLVTIEISGEEEEQSSSSSIQESAVPTSKKEVESLSSPPAKSGSGKVLATPTVRRIAAENNIDLFLIKGTGDGGRILKEDILKYIDSKTAAPAVKSSVSLPAPPPAMPLDRVEPIKGFKMIMVQTMTASGQIPQFGYCDEVLMDEVMQLRNEIKDLVKDKDIKITFMPFLIKALSMALKDYPILNAHVDPECRSITYRADHNIGMAVDTPQGLVVPNVKCVQNRSLIDIAVELHRLQELSIKGSLAPADIMGGTFSVSNIGAVGGTYARPLILPPEVCIGAFGKIQAVPKFNDKGDVVKSHVMYVSWSADHRVIEGAEVANFSNLWRKYLENPTSLLAHMV
ncbi:PREDICTED: lipoamide acyltransferase component of branched-chain alpha-keto acid dehydrogenase complex, mitochondrial-like [Amphimedon queenslandica]|uniref:Dihydrolipoamide acetyltransferase component of pyruvate dehydrogenase complex n=1 Tax=Amphimedon queenslandica TaxID=400682 RepID=A0A1X7UMT2_AMPQE|nr:PREDICTED: lipoamide acyltransferase component of branched-chain alpha-keto acid dehydrogenase complex, mitochondrial-like [Amphimedon queenslandica]|eukprot:XP_011404664.1 PREDICTED: lipoamide acyltransferase component of branched-chain alpha-keto acid dehydrogenase complex, mitochondrial-like [Amphimedon queenslandica]